MKKKLFAKKYLSLNSFIDAKNKKNKNSKNNHSKLGMKELFGIFNGKLKIAHDFDDEF